MIWFAKEDMTSAGCLLCMSWLQNTSKYACAYFKGTLASLCVSIEGDGDVSRDPYLKILELNLNTYVPLLPPEQN